MENYTLSHNVEIQLAGIAMRGGKQAKETLDKTQVTKIHNTTAADVLKAALKLHERGQGADVLTVGDELEKDGKLESVFHAGFTGRAALGKIREEANAKMAETYLLLRYGN